MKLEMDLSRFTWLNEPQNHSTQNGILKIITQPETDHWQRTYYGFQHDTSPVLVLPVGEKEFSFSVTAT